MKRLIYFLLVATLVTFTSCVSFVSYQSLNLCNEEDPIENCLWLAQIIHGEKKELHTIIEIVGKIQPNDSIDITQYDTYFYGYQVAYYGDDRFFLPPVRKTIYDCSGLCINTYYGGVNYNALEQFEIATDSQTQITYKIIKSNIIYERK